LNWLSLNGRSHGEYWLFKTDHFHADLQPISEAFRRYRRESFRRQRRIQPELSLKELGRQTKPAVLDLKALNKSGTGLLTQLSGGQ